MQLQDSHRRPARVSILIAGDHRRYCDTLPSLLASDDRPLLPGSRVVMLSSSPAVEDVERARDAGARACPTRDAGGGEIRAEVVRAAFAHLSLSAPSAA